MHIGIQKSQSEKSAYDHYSMTSGKGKNDGESKRSVIACG